jgi:four helix bundle protein
MFVAYSNALDLIRSLVPVVAQLKTYDADIADQITRAATSVALNVSEGSRRAGRDRRRFYVIARGSAGEIAGALDTADAWAGVSTVRTRAGSSTDSSGSSGGSAGRPPRAAASSSRRGTRPRDRFRSGHGNALGLDGGFGVGVGFGDGDGDGDGFGDGDGDGDGDGCGDGDGGGCGCGCGDGDGDRAVVGASAP